MFSGSCSQSGSEVDKITMNTEHMFLASVPATASRDTLTCRRPTRIRKSRHSHTCFQSLPRFLYFAASVLLFYTPNIAAESFPVRIAAAYYADAREFSTASVVVSAKQLPFGLSLWGFSDFHGDQQSNNFKLTRSFSEYRLSHNGIESWTGIKGLGLQAEFDVLSGKGNDVARAGLTYKHNLPLPWMRDSGRQGWLQWRVLPYQTNNSGSQGSLIFNVPFTERIGLTGFADYNVRDGGSNRWVIEPEINVRLSQDFYALVEYRYNQFESSNPQLDGSAFALGVRYQFN